jgi:hypothetical protein
VTHQQRKLVVVPRTTSQTFLANYHRTFGALSTTHPEHL